jgi:ArsR family transcriptional regulator
MKDVVKIFKALSDPTRLRILLLLLKRELCVCELMFILEMEQSRLSHQLKILKNADLVEDERESRWIIYRIPESARKSLVTVFGEFLNARLEDNKEVRQDVENLGTCLKEEIRKKH